MTEKEALDLLYRIKSEHEIPMDSDMDRLIEYVLEVNKQHAKRRRKK